MAVKLLPGVIVAVNNRVAEGVRLLINPGVAVTFPTGVELGKVAWIVWVGIRVNAASGVVVLGSLIVGVIVGIVPCKYDTSVALLSAAIGVPRSSMASKMTSILKPGKMIGILSAE